MDFTQLSSCAIVLWRKFCATFESGATYAFFREIGYWFLHDVRGPCPLVPGCYSVVYMRRGKLRTAARTSEREIKFFHSESYL